MFDVYCPMLLSVRAHDTAGGRCRKSRIDRVRPGRTGGIYFLSCSILPLFWTDRLTLAQVLWIISIRAAYLVPSGKARLIADLTGDRLFDMWGCVDMDVSREVEIMNVVHTAVRCPRFGLGTQIVVCLLSGALMLAIWPKTLFAEQDAQVPQAPPHAQETPDQLQQLVAPIALYPDSLVAQILAASTFPEQVVEADRWLEAHPDLKGDALGQAIDPQPWDPSVKALVAFPSILGNMDKNLSWTSSLGDAFYNQQQDVMNAVQVMRQRAQAAGNLRTTPQQMVEDQGSAITIEPASTDVVYVPAYDPWLVYGDPVLAWPGWYPYPGIWYGGPYLAFGVGFDIAFVGAFGWGWGQWGFDWRNRYALYNHGRYYSRSNTFYNRNSYYRGGGERGVARDVQQGVSSSRGGYAGRPGEDPRSPEAGRGEPSTARPFDDAAAARGYAGAGDESGIRSGAFSDYGHGGDVRGFSSRGSASFGGGGGPRGGGGGHR